jgi:molybdopterin-guanine dinucleotide biosynthesis protein A
VAVSARPGSQAAAWALGRGLPVLTDDPRHGQGPLAGVHAGLLWARGLGAERLATAPCDAMRLPPDLVARLADGAGGAIAMTADGELEPLCALWPAAAAEALDAALAEGRHPAARRMAAELGFRSVPFAEPDAFANVNTAEDLARAAGRRQV